MRFRVLVTYDTGGRFAIQTFDGRKNVGTSFLYKGGMHTGTPKSYKAAEKEAKRMQRNMNRKYV